MLYIFSSTDKLLTVLSEDTGLIETHFKDYQNLIQDETFTFSVHQSKKYSQSYDTFYNLTQVAGSFIGTIDKVESTVNVSPIEFVEEENQVAFYDKDNELRLMRMKELIEITEDGQSIIKVICEPAYLELYDHFIEDKRIVDGTAQLALNRALEGSRYIGEVTLDLGNATDNFYWIDGVEAVFSILDTWGGALKDTITLDDNNNIIERKLWINARLGADNGLIVEPDYNAESIERRTLSYIETALWGQGSSLEIEDEQGELTGGHTRYITFEDVVWSKSKGDPANKPKGQKWIGDEDARLEHGYIHNGVRKHRFGHFSNQDYETPEELLMATWQALQERKLKEVVHEASIYEDEKGASLGDTVTILNREYSKPIELQSQITGLEYDLLYPKELDITIGKYIDMSEDPLQKEVDDLKVQAEKPPKPITDISFPDIKPGTPVNFTATGAFQTIQLFWDYDSKVYISHYEVYGSQISDFVPDEQQLLYRGRVSAFSHEVSTDEKWYYYVRAVNTRGTAGEFSHRVSASSVRINTPDILFGSVTNDILADLAVSEDKIQEQAIKTAHIDNLAVDKFHLKHGIIENVHIHDATIEHGKIKSIDADKITVGDLRGIDIYGAKFRSSAGTDYMEIVGGNIDLMLNNGRYMNLSPTGLYGYNASGSVRFQADSSMVTSAVLGTSTANVYLAAQSGQEARMVTYTDLPGTGNPAEYNYIPVRASGFKGNYLDVNHQGSNAIHLYLRTPSGGEIRATSVDTTDVWRPIRAHKLYAEHIETNNFEILSLRTNDRVRILGKGSSTTYQNLQANRLFIRSMAVHPDVTVVKDMYLGSNDEVRSVNGGFIYGSSEMIYRGFRGSSFNESSSREIKENIKPLTETALDVINNLDVMEYNLKGHDAKPSPFRSMARKERHVGFIAEESNPISSDDGEAINLGKVSAYNTKAIQELSGQLSRALERIEELEGLIK